MRPAGRSSPGRRPRRLPGRGPAAVCRSYPRRTNSARQTGLRFAALIRVIERAVELAAALSLPGGATGPHDELPVDPAADGVHDLVRGVARCRSCRLGLVQVEGTPWWRSGPAWRTASASGQRPSGLGSARGLSPPPQLPGRVALADRLGQSSDRLPALRGRCTQRVPSGSRPTPASLSGVRATPSSATCRPAGQPGRFARNDTASALRRLAVPADRRLHARAKGASSARAHQRDLPAGGAPAARGPRVTRRRDRETVAA